MFVAWQVERVLRDTVSRPLDRRQFLTLSGLAISAQPFHALACRSPTKPGSEPDLDSVGYGPLQPVNDQTTGLPLLYLPNGFQYVSFGWTEDPLSGGLVPPGMHDGMAAFAGPGNTVRLVRNHEIRSGRAFENRPVYPVYDVNGGGGNTTLGFDIATGRVFEARVSLTGTAVNCAGGVTPWGSWLTCEETVSGPGGTNGYERPHGYIFEVPVVGTATAEPLAAMGRFVHEATCVDPVTGVVYETEDQDTAGFYRFLPDEFGNLAAGGRLEMLAFSGFPQLDTRTTEAGVWTPVHWVPIDDPDPADATASSVLPKASVRVAPDSLGSKERGLPVHESISCRPRVDVPEWGRSGNTIRVASESVSSLNHQVEMYSTCQITSARVLVAGWSYVRTVRLRISSVVSRSVVKSLLLPEIM